MKKLFILIPLLFSLSGCEGYRSINSTAPQAGAINVNAADIHIQSVEMTSIQQKVGERRIAQKMAQELSRRYVGGENAPFQVQVILSESQSSLASRRDATVSRWMYFLSGRAIVTHNGKQVANISSRADAPYFVENSPIATQANLKQAKEAAASVLTRDLHRQLNVLLHEYSQGKLTD